jgi:hypothetical protein
MVWIGTIPLTALTYSFNRAQEHSSFSELDIPNHRKAQEVHPPDDSVIALKLTSKYLILDIPHILDKLAFCAAGHAGGRIGPIRACRQAAGVVGSLPTAIQRIPPPWGRAANIYFLEVQLFTVILGVIRLWAAEFENQRPSV